MKVRDFVKLAEGKNPIIIGRKYPDLLCPTGHNECFTCEHYIEDDSEDDLNFCDLDTVKIYREDILFKGKVGEIPIKLGECKIIHVDVKDTRHKYGKKSEKAFLLMLIVE